MAYIGTIFTFMYHTMQLNPWAISSASHVVNYNQLSACQGELESFEDHQRHLWPYNPQKQTTAKAAWVTFSINTWAELLVNVYSYYFTYLL